jgi:hypothetical protein
MMIPLLLLFPALVGATLLIHHRMTVVRSMAPEFADAQLSIFAPNAFHMWKRKEVSVRVTCLCGEQTTITASAPMQSHALCCIYCGRTWSHLHTTIQASEHAFTEHLRNQHGSN